MGWRKKIKTNHHCPALSWSKSLCTVLFAVIVLAAGAANQAWGTNYTAIDLNPSRFNSSFAYGAGGTQQVGGGSGSATGGHVHALLWNGSAASYIDLHQFLPIGFGSSFANGIDGYGNIVGYATGSSGTHAILWVIPEPASMSLLVLGGLALLGRRRM